MNWIPFLVGAVASNLAACGNTTRSAPKEPTTPIFLMPPPASPPTPIAAPWHAELAKSCGSAPAVSRARLAPAGDVDGDGRADFVETTCSEQADTEACVMRLCLSAAQGGGLMAAAWTARAPQSVVALGGAAVPRDFEAFEVTDTGAGECIVGRRFHWVQGRGGYLGTQDHRCACKTSAGAALPPGCARVAP